MCKDTKVQKDESWPNVKTNLLGNSALLKDLMEYQIHTCTKDMAARAKKGLGNLEKQIQVTGDRKSLLEEIKYKSQAAGGLLRWC